MPSFVGIKAQLRVAQAVVARTPCPALANCLRVTEGDFQISLVGRLKVVSSSSADLAPESRAPSIVAGQNV